MSNTRQQDPDSGGQKITDNVKRQVEQRILKYVETNLAGRYTRFDIRFRDEFCYVDAYDEPDVIEDWPANFSETREEHIERMRNTPIYLCRLCYFGDEEQWGIAFYSYANNEYETSVFSDGKSFGTPEQAVKISTGF